MKNNEQERLKAVERFKQVDAGIIKDLDELTSFVALLCDKPIALVSLIDENMQWFKASVGTGKINCTQRELSFCTHTIQQEGLLIIPDALADERFAKLPVVTDEPHIRFYAGVSLVTYDGLAVGSLCVLDTKPGELTTMQVSALKVIAKQVSNLLELNWSLQALMTQHEQTQIQKRIIEDSEVKLNAIFNSSKDIHVLADKNMEVLAFNTAASIFLNNLEKSRLKAGDPIINYFAAELHDDFVSYYCAALNGQATKVEWLMNSNENQSRWYEIHMSPVTDISDYTIGVAINAVDITLNKSDTEQITRQNEALQRIATLQNHELRRPVASLMGLMEVINMEDGTTGGSYYNMMKTTVQELDNKIRYIVHESENTIVSISGGRN